MPCSPGTPVARAPVPAPDRMLVECLGAFGGGPGFGDETAVDVEAVSPGTPQERAGWVAQSPMACLNASSTIVAVSRLLNHTSKPPKVASPIAIVWPSDHGKLTTQPPSCWVTWALEASA